MKLGPVLVAALCGAACSPVDTFDTVLEAGRADVRTDATRGDARVDGSALADGAASDLGRNDGSVRADGAATGDATVDPDAASPADGSAVDGSASDGSAADVPVDTGPPPCVDTDSDGISDDLEGAPFLHTSMVASAPADYMNPDSDDDMVPDLDEAHRNYPGFASAATPALACGDLPDDCDADGLPNHRDRDSDNDGLTDTEETTRTHTNPCAADSDGDGVSDLVESAAGSSPLDPMSRPPAGSLYVTLPYMDPMGPQQRDFDFSTNIRSADIMFLVDTTGSMSGTISAVRSELSTVIVPGIVRAIGAGADVRYGMAEHHDFANGSSGDFAYRRLQPLNANAMLSQTATNSMVANGGGDEPEAMVPAMHSLLSGFGMASYLGTATHVMTAADCAGDATAYGWGCFQPGRVPIVVLFSDAEWHNGPSMATTNFYTSAPGTPTYTDLVAAFHAHDAYFVGIDVGRGATFADSQALARDTRTLDAAGAPIAFHGAPSTVSASVVSAISTLAHGTRQDVTRQALPDTAETRLEAGHDTTNFMRSIVPLRGTPAAPTGFDHMDATTFYSVSPSTVVTFEVTFFNDFHHNISGAAQLFRATINVLGRASSILSTIQVFMIVPTDSNTIPG